LVIFAKGLGRFVIPIGFVIPVGVQFSIKRIWGAEFYTAHDGLFSSLSYLAGAFLLWRIGRWVNPPPLPGEFQVVSARAHHFFGIRFEYWAIPFALLALLVAVPWERLPNYQPPAGIIRPATPPQLTPASEARMMSRALAGLLTSWSGAVNADGPRSEHTPAAVREFIERRWESAMEVDSVQVRGDDVWVQLRGKRFGVRCAQSSEDLAPTCTEPAIRRS
jgi:hypothetical protein